jgi:glycosyltransferase involved in cell wall biosynthesis
LTLTRQPVTGELANTDADSILTLPTDSLKGRSVCLISHGQPAANPRLVRDAGALAAAGHSVRVVTARFISRLIEHDEKLVRGASWHYEAANLLGRNGGSWQWDYVRFRRRMAAELADWLPFQGLVARGYAYGHTEVAKLAAKEPADLFVAYQHNSLPAAAWAARINHSKFALDAQDLLADCSDEPTKLAASLERRYLRQCSYVSTMSHPAAERLQQTNALIRRPIVLHNTPPLVEREGLSHPSVRAQGEPLSIYWFGQTIGPHSCAGPVLKAIARLDKPVQLVLRGNPIEAYVNQLLATAQELGIAGQLIILPRAEPSEMVRLAGEHDILLGSQPGVELFNQLAIGNKVFTGMMAGLALALSDTVAHRELLSENPNCGFLFRDGDVDSLGNYLDDLLRNHAQLKQMKTSAWNLAESRFNWERESKKLLETINRIIPVSAAQVIVG